MRLIRGDVLDREACGHSGWADTVIWLAAIVGDPACALDPELTRWTNCRRWNTWSRTSGPHRVPSTCSVYGAQEGVLTEDSPLEPLSLYAETKVAAERVLLDSGADVVVFRLGTLFGLGDAFSRLRNDLVLNVLTIRAVLTGRMSVFGGHQYRPLLHVRDVATAMVPNIDGSNTGEYTTCTPRTSLFASSPSASAITSTARRSTSRETTFQDSRNYKVSSQRAISDFGFAPAVDDRRRHPGGQLGD